MKPRVASGTGDPGVSKVLLKARLEALLAHAPPAVLKDLERAIAIAEQRALAAHSPRKKGRPALPVGTHRELKLNVELQQLLSGGRRITDKEAVERLVYVARPKHSSEERRQVVKLWRTRIASAKKKSRN